MFHKTETNDMTITFRTGLLH